jgi:hypothetical protein
VGPGHRLAHNVHCSRCSMLSPQCSHLDSWCLAAWHHCLLPALQTQWCQVPIASAIMCWYHFN